MDQRQDTLFRQVVEQVSARASIEGFTMRERTTTDGTQWVEFSRWQHAQPLCREELVLLHAPDQRCVGVRLFGLRRAGEPSGAVRITQVWSYEAGIFPTTRREVLPATVAAWVERAISAASRPLMSETARV
jgi:hypothetical protein